MTHELKAKCREKAKRITQPIPVEVPGIGRMYVRPQKMREKDSFNVALQDDDYGRMCVHVASLLCEENGERLSEQDQSEFAEIFMDMAKADVVLIGNAASGQAPEPGN